MTDLGGTGTGTTSDALPAPAAATPAAVPRVSHPIPIQQVALAKALLRRGADLGAAADALGLNSWDLDRALRATVGQRLSEHLPLDLKRRTGS